MNFTIFTDGASRGNPGPGGYGAIISDGKTVREIGGREDNTTNNRMEILAAVRALQTISSPTTTLAIDLHTDSAYLINGATKWLHGWKKNNWQTKAKEDVLNQDLWEELAEAMEDKKITWHKLSGHSGVPANERCDAIATGFADGVAVRLFTGAVEEYKINLTVIDTGRKNSTKKSGSKTPAYSYVSAINGKIFVDATWAACEARVKGVSGARYKKSVSATDEAEIIEQFSR